MRNIYSTLLFSFFCTLSIFSNAQESDNTQLDLENNEDYSTFSLLDEDVQDYKIFFIGENHNFKKSNVGLQLKMFKYLYETADVRAILFESGKARGWLVNEYVQTGDTTYMDILDQYSFNYYAELYEGLKSFNDSLPEDKKIQVIGIDVERSLPTSIKVLELLVPEDKTPPESIRLDIESLLGLVKNFDQQNLSLEQEQDEDKEDDYYYFDYYGVNPETSVKEIIQNFDSLKTDYQTFLGDKYDFFEEVLLEIEEGQKWYDYRNSRMIQSDYFREEYMYQRMLDLVEKNPDLKFFGQFGRCHTTLQIVERNWCDWYNFNSLASRLNNGVNENLKDKIMAIGVFYTNNIDRYPKISFDDNISSIVDKLEEKEGLHLVGVAKDTTVSEDLKKYFQYVIVNNNNPEDELDEKETNALNADRMRGGRARALIGMSKGQLLMNIEDLNTFFTSQNADVFETPIYSTGGFITASNRNSDITLSIDKLDALQNTLNTTNSVTDVQFEGYSVGLDFGSDIIKKRFLDIVPSLGVSYKQLQLKLTNNDVVQGETFLDSNAPIVYTNPAFAGNVSLRTRVNVSILSLGAKLGYILDFSDGKWKANSQKLLDSPKTKWSGLYGKVELGLKLGR